MIFIFKIKYKAFSLYETIFSILVFSLFINFSYLKFQNFKENQSVKEAKIKLNEIFFEASTSSLKFHKTKYLDINLVKKTITLKNEFLISEKTIFLPKNLFYYPTLQNAYFSVKIHFTPNGNISKSFSIYIFNKKNLAKYKISFLGFDKSKFLKINNYKKKNNGSKIYFSNIANYNTITNKDRDSFYLDWKKE